MPDCGNTVKVFYFLNANLEVNLDADFFFKGRLFRRWYQKTRLKRLLRQEDELKLQRYITGILILNVRKIPTHHKLMI